MYSLYIQVTALVLSLSVPLESVYPPSITVTSTVTVPTVLMRPPVVQTVTSSPGCVVGKTL